MALKLQNREYWKIRQQQLINQLESDEKKLIQKLSKAFDKQQKLLEREIAEYYQKYGRNNVIAYRNLLGKLPAGDKELLFQNMDAFSAKYPQYKYLMPVRESIYQLNRMEGLQYSVMMQQYELGANEIKLLYNHLEKQYLSAANVAVNFLGQNPNAYAVNADILKKTINAQWCNGENFSDRIWKNRQSLSNYLNTDFAQAIARGDSYDKIVNRITRRFDVSKNNAYCLVYTEGTHVLNEGLISPFDGLFDEYAISSIMDSKTCDICAAMDGIIFKIEDRQPGYNFPPFHARCRCTFTIALEKDEKSDKIENNIDANESKKYK